MRDPIRRRYFTFLVALAGTMLVLAFAAYQFLESRPNSPSAAFKPVSASPHSVVPFSLPDIDGRLRHSTEWKNKIVLLNFWATWCEPCRQEIPLLIAMQQSYADAGLQVIGVAIDTPSLVRPFADDIGINYPVLIDAFSGDNVLNQYGGDSLLPYSVIIDRNGQVQATKLGIYKNAELIALLQPLW